MEFRFSLLGTGEFAKVITAGNGFIVPLSDRMFSAPDGHVIVRFYLAVKLKMELGVNVVSGKMGLESGLFWWWLFVASGHIIQRHYFGSVVRAAICTGSGRAVSK